MNRYINDIDEWLQKLNLQDAAEATTNAILMKLDFLITAP